MSAPADPTGLTGPDAELKAAHAAINERIAQLPDAQDDGGLSIYRELLSARTWQDLNNPYNGKSMIRWNGRELIVDQMHKMPSTMRGPLAWYVVAHAAASDTGEEAVFVTSSRSAVIQLTTAYLHGWLPLVVVPRVSKRPTDRGHYPHYLDIIGVIAPAPAGGA